MAFYKAHPKMRAAALKYGSEVVAYINNPKIKKTEGDSEMLINAIELISYMVDPRAEDFLLGDIPFTSGWIALRGVARQDPATVVPKLIALFDHGFKSTDNRRARLDVTLAYGAMFESGRLSADNPHYAKIKSQLVTLGASRNVNDRVASADTLGAMPQDAEVTAALERLAKDPSEYVRHNATAALSERAERFKAGVTTPAR